MSKLSRLSHTYRNSTEMRFGGFRWVAGTAAVNSADSELVLLSFHTRDSELSIGHQIWTYWSPVLTLLLLLHLNVTIDKSVSRQQVTSIIS